MNCVDFDFLMMMMMMMKELMEKSVERFEIDFEIN